MNNILSRLAPAVALCLPLVAVAQPGRADPAGSQASAPALRYQSAFVDYKPWQDAKPGDWRALNDALQGNAGDHAGHSMPSTPPAPAPKASAPAHGGHPMHGGKP